VILIALGISFEAEELEILGERGVVGHGAKG
jgi:hypothetical protein